MLSAFVLSANGQSFTETIVEIVELEEVEAVPPRKLQHGKCSRVDFVGNLTLRRPLRHIAQLPYRSQTERDRFNGIGGYLLV